MVNIRSPLNNCSFCTRDDTLIHQFFLKKGKFHLQRCCFPDSYAALPCRTVYMGCQNIVISTWQRGSGIFSAPVSRSIPFWPTCPFHPPLSPTIQGFKGSSPPSVAPIKSSPDAGCPEARKDPSSPSSFHLFNLSRVEAWCV